MLRARSVTCWSKKRTQIDRKKRIVRINLLGDDMTETVETRLPDDALHRELTDRIIKCYYQVYNALGYGFLEKVYENALKHELIKNGLTVESQREIKVFYDGVQVGYYVSDLLVEGVILLELKAVDMILPAYEYQLLNYLKATDIEVGLILNFGPKPTIKRRSFSNLRKSLLPAFKQ